MPRITLLSDFGTRDGYVGAMKGVMAAIYPGVAMDDISHDLPAGDVAAAALVLERYWDRYPGGTVHLCVVDPGVGTARRALAVEVQRRFLVLPDNGLAGRVVSRASKEGGGWRAVSLENQEYMLDQASSTFHGRDVFAPAAAYLARGVHLSRLGPTVDDLVRLPESAPKEYGEMVRGQVISVDRFGNLVTDIPGDRLAGVARVIVGERSVPVRSTYGDVESGEALALVNSDERVEVAVRDGSAARILEGDVGTRVCFRVPGRSAGPGSEKAAATDSEAGGSSTDG